MARGTYALVALSLCAVLIATGPDSSVSGSYSGASYLLPACRISSGWLVAAEDSSYEGEGGIANLTLLQPKTAQPTA